MRYLVAATLALFAALAFYLTTDMACGQKNGPKIADAILIGGCRKVIIDHDRN
jgi:hypothetical protein